MSGQKPKVNIYTDGACSGNPGPGGWGVYLEYNNVTKEAFGYSLATTNNQMELTAVSEGLKILKKSCIVNLYTDSKYVYLGMTEWIKKWRANNWRNASGDEIKNIQFWQELYSESLKHDINWNWVKGHADNFGNNIADKLAGHGSKIAKELYAQSK